MVNKKKLDFWNERAWLGEIAGSNDFILKRIEMQIIQQRVRAGSTVLDIGCGNGDTLIQLAINNKCTGVGIDFAPDMIKAAKKACEKIKSAESLIFEEGYIPGGFRSGLGEFDYIISERCLINLDDAYSQKKAFHEIMSHLKVDGLFLMIEDSCEGLEKLNAMRQILGLEAIPAPWHNVFLSESDVLSWANSNCFLEEFVPFSGTYYFLSRVVYAYLARERGEELRYDSDINLLALKLPSVCDLGAVRLWVWRRIA